MLINNKNLSEFNAKLIDIQIHPAEHIVNSFWPKNSVIPYTDKNIKYQYKLLTLDIELKGSPSQIEDNKSQLTKEFGLSTIKFDSVVNFHRGHMIDTSIKNTNIGYQVISVSLAVVEEGNEITETLNHVASKTINVPGNLPTPAIVKITPAIDMVSLALTGLTKNPIVVKNLLANVPVIVDGENCTVTEADIDTVITSATGANKWNFRKYNIANILDPDNTDIHLAPTHETIPKNSSYSQKLLSDGETLFRNLGYDYLVKLRTAVNVVSAKTIAFDFYHDDGCTIYLNGAVVYSNDYHAAADNGAGHASMNLLAGWNAIEIIMIQHFGPDGFWNINPTIASQVTALNCFYAKGDGLGVVNKFADTDMWSFPVLQPGANTIGVSNANCTVDIKYKPKYI